MYCTVEEVAGMIKDDMIDVILGDQPIEDREQQQEMLRELIPGAIGDACSEIDGYLAGRYPVPFEKTPAMLNKLAKDIAVYNLVSRQGIDESSREKNYLNRYNQAIKFLTAVAEGKIDIGTSDKSSVSGAGTDFRVESPSRIFSRNSMKGW